MLKLRVLLAAGLTLLLAGLGVGVYLGCHGTGVTASPGGDGRASQACPGGTDADGDGYGVGCPNGTDCDDKDPSVHDGVAEICDGKDNNCDGQVDEGFPECKADAVGGGGKPFPVDKNADPNLQDATGVQVDENGDLTLGSDLMTYRFVWIANTDDFGRGSLSKVDSKTLKEVARYITVTCRSLPNATGCRDANNKVIQAVADYTPSRTAVDFNMDVWVANRCLSKACQPSVTKIANDPIDCIDRNHNGKIDTSQDQNGDNQITVDCDGNGQPDNLSTKCTGALAGKTPEFLGDDDECLLFTTAYGDVGDIGRSVCLNAGKSTVGPSDAWVGTYLRPEQGRGNNLYFKINGATGAIDTTVEMPPGHHAYGCTADAHNVIWSTDIGRYETQVDGNLTYFQAISPYLVGEVMRGPSNDKRWTSRSHQYPYRHYGICVNADQHLWLGGIEAQWVLRYKPDRTSFETLGKGTWTRIDMPRGFSTRGLMADNRGKVWVAIQEGYLLRLEQNIADGVHDLSGLKENQDYWRVAAQEVIGAGVDFDGNIWAVGKGNNMASRLDVDDKGNVITPATGTTNNVVIGTHPYTYSDFTGYGLATYVRPQGRWSYLHQPCPEGQKAYWKQVTWAATTPPETGVAVRVRSGDNKTSFGSWSAEASASPAEIAPGAASAVSPNPSMMLQVEFVLTSSPDKLQRPVLHDYAVVYDCIAPVE